MSRTSWSQLVSTCDISADPIEISKDKFIIGRSKTADLCLIGNKLVSGTHCFIEKDSDGKVWLQDTSTNGTLLNFHQKLVGTRKELKHGDEIHLIYKKSEEHLNVSYLYQDLAELAKEEAEECSETDASGTNQTIPEDSSPLRKRHRTDFSDEESVEGPTEKKSKKDETEENKKLKEEECKENDSKDKKAEDIKHESTKDESKTKPETEKSSASDEGMEESLICIICQEILHDCVSCQPCMHSFCGGCYSDWMKRSNECPSCRKKVKRVSKNHIVNNLVEVFLKSHPDKKRPEADIKELDTKNKIRSDPVKPPRPRKTLSEVVDEDSFYEDADADDDEDEEEEEEDEDDEEEYENSEDLDDPSSGGIGTGFGGGGVFGGPLPFRFTGMTGAFGTIRPPRTVCRQCPGYRDPYAVSPIAAATSAVTTALAKMAGAVTGGATGSGDASTSADTKDENKKVMPEPPKFTCSPTQTHILCSCCLQPMPDRRLTAAGTTIPKIECSLCHRAFCQLYWGCRKAECLGCLGKFKELNFGRKALSGIVLENTYESDILKNYLEGKKIAVKAFVRECCDKLTSGDYSTLDQVRGFTTDSVVCYSCGLRNLREMAYQYRKNVKAEELPTAVTSRPDCYWGKNCRTQKNKITHSARFNHICDQSRT